jgi:hypothetical protein
MGLGGILLFCRGISTPTDKAGLPQALSKATRILALPLAGIMNLYWMIGLAATVPTVLIEKVFSVGPKLSAIAGAFFIVWAMPFELH